MRSQSLKAPGPSTSHPLPPKPLWRLGWSFWLLLPLAITLTVVYITGYDLRTQIQTIVADQFGIPTLYWFTIRGITANSLAIGRPPPIPMFTVIAAWCILVGPAIHPRRFGRWRGVLVLLLGLAAPGLWLTLHSTVSRWFPAHDPRISDPIAQVLGTLVSQTGIALLGAITVLVLFRARVIALTLVLLALLGAWLTIEFDWTIGGGELLLPKTYAWLGFTWISWFFNPLLLAASIHWGISARRAYKPEWACQACGYDLRASTSDQCPECGTLIPVTSTETTGQS